MDINWLVQRLRHGEIYTAHTEEGEPYTVTHPPTSVSMKAADFLIQQSNQLQSIAETNQSLMRQIQDLNEKYEQIYKTSTTSKAGTQT